MSQIFLATLENQELILEKLSNSGGGDSYIYQLAEFDSTATAQEMQALKSKRSIKEAAASSKAMKAIVASHSAIKAIVASKSAMKTMVESSVAMAAMATSSIAMTEIANSDYITKLENTAENKGNFIIIGAESDDVLDKSIPTGAESKLNGKVTLKFNSKYGELYNCLEKTGNQVYTMLDPYFAQNGKWVYCLDLDKLK